MMLAVRVFEDPFTYRPLLALGTASCPVTSVPTRLPCTVLLLVPMSIPWFPLPETRLPSPAAEPPIWLPLADP